MQLVIAQRYIGSVIKQSVGDDNDSDDGMDDPNEVYAVSTVINLSEKNRYKTTLFKDSFKNFKLLIRKHGCNHCCSLFSKYELHIINFGQF